MSGRYKESCMKFTNEELKKYLYDRFYEYPDLQIRCLSEDEEELTFIDESGRNVYTSSDVTNNHITKKSSVYENITINY